MATVCTSKICCHIVGSFLTLVSIVLLIGGFVLLIVFSSDFDSIKDWSLQYSIGIAAIAVGTLTSILAVIYLFIAFRRGWHIYGCVKIKAPSKTLSQSLTGLPSKDQLNKTGDTGSRSDYVMEEKASTVQRVSAYDIQRQHSKTDKAETEWDPDTILKDDDMY